MKALLFSLALLCLVWPLNVPTGAAWAAEASRPVFEPSVCPDGVEDAQCGYVTVPENRAKPGRSIRLFTAVVRSRFEGRKPDPVFFLTGGPGEKAMSYPRLWGWYEDRDFVVFDQRGIGYSQPALECPELFSGKREGLGLEAMAAREYEALQACGRRYRKRGIDLSAYNATESAADIEAVRQALGYGPINLVGVSYGTRLAQEYMRRFSPSLRAVVLDSVVPPSIDRSAEMPYTAESALQTVFAACAAEPGCARAYPDLPMRFSELVQHLDAAGGITDEYTKPLEVFELLTEMFYRLYHPDYLQALPALIYRLHTGDQAARSLVEKESDTGPTLNDLISWGAFFAVECQGEIAFSKPGALEKAYDELPHWRKALGVMPGVSSLGMRDLCRDWGLTEPSAQENDAVSSDVPTLLLGGRFDPVTPPRYMALAAEKLTRAHIFELPNFAHAVSMRNSCVMSMIQVFIQDPTQPPDYSCDGLNPFAEPNFSG